MAITEDSSIDVEASVKASKGLIIITIVLALLMNFALLFKIVRQSGGLRAVVVSPRAPRSLTLVGLVVGDVVMTLYSLVLQARVIFENASNPSVFGTTSMWLSLVYMAYVMPLVYGIGLVVLSVENIMFRLGVQAAVSPQSLRVVVSLAVGAIPWFFGLPIALPLTMADLDWNNIVKRQRAMYIVCQLVPAVVAVLATAVNSCIISSRGSTADSPRPMMLETRDSDDEELLHSDEVRLVPEIDSYTSALYLVSIMFFVCVVPSAVFGLAYELNIHRSELPPLLYVIIRYLTQWLVYMRSFVLPLLWLVLTNFRG